MPWMCPKCKEQNDEDDVLNCWNCDFEKTIDGSNVQPTTESAPVLGMNKATAKSRVPRVVPVRKATSVISVISMVIFLIAIVLTLFSFSFKNTGMMIFGVSLLGLAFISAICALIFPPYITNKIHAKIVVGVAILSLVVRVFIASNR
jgi:hypothetical protein